MRYRSGIGYDVHAFAEGRPLVLGGVTGVGLPTADGRALEGRDGSRRGCRGGGVRGAPGDEQGAGEQAGQDEQA